MAEYKRTLAAAHVAPLDYTHNASLHFQINDELQHTVILMNQLGGGNLPGLLKPVCVCMCVLVN